MGKGLFVLGQLTITPAAINAFSAAGITPFHVLKKHVTGDWGDCDEHDSKANNSAIAHEGDEDLQERVFSVYTLTTGVVVWVITEWDRSLTTVLLPSDY